MKNFRRNPSIRSRHSSSFNGNYFSCNKFGYRASDCRNQNKSQSFNGQCYYCNKFGNKSSESRSRIIGIDMVIQALVEIFTLSIDVMLATTLGIRLLSAFQISEEMKMETLG